MHPSLDSFLKNVFMFSEYIISEKKTLNVSNKITQSAYAEL